MQETERGTTAEFSFVSLCHPQPDHNEVAVRFERASTSSATAAVAAAAAAAKSSPGILTPESADDAARRDTYLLFYVRDMAETLEALQAYDLKRAESLAEQRRLRSAHAAIHHNGHVSVTHTDSQSVRVESSLIVAPSKRNGVCGALIRDPNGMKVRLVEFDRQLVLVSGGACVCLGGWSATIAQRSAVVSVCLQGQGGHLPSGPARPFEQGWFARPEGHVRPAHWEARLAYLVTPAVDVAEVRPGHPWPLRYRRHAPSGFSQPLFVAWQAVRFYETHLCGSEATVVERMKRRPVGQGRNAFGLYADDDELVCSDHQSRGNVHASHPWLVSLAVG